MNNCGQFRAIKDIPLPFHIHYESDTSEPEETDDEGSGSSEQDQGDKATVDDQGVKVAPLERKSSHATFKSSGGQGAADAAGGSRISVYSNNRRGSQAPPPERLGVNRSNTFVDAAMAEAGFKDSQREELQRQADAAASTFFNRRDFDTKMDDDGLFIPIRSSPRRTRTGFSPANALSPVGLGLNMDGAGGVSQFDLPAAVTPRRKPSIGKRLFGRRDDSDDEHDDDTE